MITQLMVIQKLNEDGSIDIFQITSNNFQWTFENRRNKTKEDKDYFPFELFGKTEVLKVKPGAETKISVRDNEITFSDDYGVPGGTVVGILLPKNHIPDIVKFKDKPYIPSGLVGQVITKPPGQFQILYNYPEKRCAIIFNVHENIVFGFQCISKLVEDNDYPQDRDELTESVFDVILSRDFLNVDSITNDELKLINDTLDQTDLTDIHQTLNELLYSVKAGQIEKSKSLLNKVGTLLLNGTSTLSSLTTIVDSYRTGGASQQFVGRVMEYITNNH